MQNFPIVLTGIGNVTALNSATVPSLVTEQILSVDFKELDPSTYQAQLDRTRSCPCTPRPQ
jgi:multidrug efflux system membrane fusion protein